jgi:hypothetical protein
MVKYNCPRCGYETKLMGDIKKHLNRVNICKPKLSDTIPNDHKNEILNHNTTIIPKCTQCNKNFSRLDSLKRHEKNCKQKVTEINESLVGTHNGYFYIFQLREHVRLNENVYKIGKTERDIVQRFKEYPKGSKMILGIINKNCSDFEMKVKNHLKTICIHRTDCGEEYFEGSINKILQEVLNLIE